MGNEIADRLHHEGLSLAPNKTRMLAFAIDDLLISFFSPKKGHRNFCDFLKNFLKKFKRR